MRRLVVISAIAAVMFFSLGHAVVGDGQQGGDSLEKKVDSMANTVEKLAEVANKSAPIEGYSYGILIAIIGILGFTILRMAIKDSRKKKSGGDHMQASHRKE